MTDKEKQLIDQAYEDEFKSLFDSYLNAIEADKVIKDPCGLTAKDKIVNGVKFLRQAHKDIIEIIENVQEIV